MSVCKRSHSLGFSTLDLVNAADSESPLCNIAGTVSVFMCRSLRCKVAWDWVSLNIGYLGISLAVPQPGKLG